MVLLDERSAEVESRLIAGYYEGDLTLGEGYRSAVEVLVERTTHHNMLCRLKQKVATKVLDPFSSCLVGILSQQRLSLTCDQGEEVILNKSLAAALGFKVFFLPFPKT